MNSRVSSLARWRRGAPDRWPRGPREVAPDRLLRLFASAAPLHPPLRFFLVQWRVKRRSGGKRAQWVRANRRASSPAVQKGGQRVLFAPRPALLPSRGGAMGPSHQKVPRTGRDRRGGAGGRAQGGAGGAPVAVRGGGVSESVAKALRAGIGREKKRGISTFLLALRRDQDLCNRFGQPAPPGPLAGGGGRLGGSRDEHPGDPSGRDTGPPGPSRCSRRPDVHFALERAVPTVVLECEMHVSARIPPLRRPGPRAGRPVRIVQEPGRIHSGVALGSRGKSRSSSAQSSALTTGVISGRRS